jgi:thioredoxin-dependent peroxiredoxin
MLLQEGVVAPAFQLPDHRGETVGLDDLTGRWVVLWWFPKAATPG